MKRGTEFTHHFVYLKCPDSLLFSSINRNLKARINHKLTTNVYKPRENTVRWLPYYRDRIYSWYVEMKQTLIKMPTSLIKSLTCALLQSEER